MPKKLYLTFLFALLIPLGAFSQLTIHGRVLDAESGESVIGARILIPNTSLGTITDLDGEFHLAVQDSLPVLLSITSIGFEEESIFLADSLSFLEINLIPYRGPGKAVVVSASRVEERILEAPVSIERLGPIDMKYKPALRIHDALSALPGVMSVSSSFGFQSVNTRGFGNVQNWRVLQLVDGMDVSGPGVNYAVGNVLTGSELDVRNVEVVPGAGSALYGANAFNGIVSTRTKSPFDYPGLSSYLRQGYTRTDEFKSNPLLDVGIRFAKVFDDKWAMKFNISYLDAKEWAANDQSFLITNGDIPFIQDRLGTDRNDPNYNAVNVYGDETTVMVNMGDSIFAPVNRSGINENLLLDPSMQSLTLQASLHYRITSNIEASYDFRHAKSDAVIRYDNFYPFQNFETSFHKFELAGDKFFLRAYQGTDNPGDGYSMLQAGAIVQEGLKPSDAWGEDYGLAFRGQVPGINAGNHLQAREFADRDVDPGFEQDLELGLNRTRSVPISLPGGSQVTYESKIYHLEGNYQFLEEIPWFNLQAGGSLRRYNLRSNGHVYNDGPGGFGGDIPVTEFGGYLQADRRLLDDHLHLRASIRYDKHQEFNGRLSPRGSAVISLGDKNEHHFRFSGQTGFRNPANQDMYVAFNAGQLIYLGNAESNIENYSYQNQSENSFTGQEIYESLVTYPSFLGFMAAGGTDPSLLEPANLSFLRQEQITTVEFGYRTLLWNRLYVDASGYYNWYKDFTANVLSISPTAGVPFLTLVNVPEEVTSLGANASLDLVLPRNFRVGASYTYTEFDASAATQANPNYFPDFNFPANMIKASVGNRDIYEGLGFQVQYRWLDGYTFQAPNGQSEIPDRQVMDASVFYHLKPVKCILKLGAMNLLQDNFTPIYGGPTIGSTYYFQVTFDELMK